MDLISSLSALPGSTVLANGIRVFFRQTPPSGLVSVQVWVKSGSVHEGEFLGAGISHYLEHMVFKGTEKFSSEAITKKVQALGGSMNAYTTFSRTVYHVDLPAESAETAFDVLSQMTLSSDLRHIVETGLACIPQRSRLKRDIDTVLALYDEGLAFMEAVDRIHEQYPQNHLHNAVHTIPNAMIVVASLLWGEGDYTRTLGYSVMAAMDTDCNGATVGSIVGMINGADAIPAHFTDPIHDTLCTDIVGNASVSISRMAERTMKLIR